MEPTYPPETEQINYLDASERWETRPRALEDENQAMLKTLTLAEGLVEMLGRDLAAWVILEVERKVWQLKNSAGQLQKNRQDWLGMGWANHDHYTFRPLPNISKHSFMNSFKLFHLKPVLRVTNCSSQVFSLCIHDIFCFHSIEII
jgi:hypothetical protein